MDPKTKTVRDSPNTNRLIVMKLDQKDLGPETAKVAAEGIVGYSAVCTHQNCVVNGWVEKDKELLCVCHFSKFSPLRAGEVTGGPAPRPLPSIPLKIDGGKLAIAGDFSAKPGGQV
jgi:Rieske Fe-S protein